MLPPEWKAYGPFPNVWLLVTIVTQEEARRDIAKLLDTLPDRQRLPIVHVKIEGLSVLEAARLTGMSESAVKVGVHRGLKALAAKLREGT